MAATNPSTILLKGEPNRKEREAGGAISPGDLVSLNSSDNVVVHPTSGGNAVRWFAVENDIAGDDLDHAYASGEKVQVHSARPGDEMYIYLASGENVAIGDFLESNGDGTLKKFVADSAAPEEGQSIVAMALAALNLSASGSADTRVKVEIV